MLASGWFPDSFVNDKKAVLQVTMKLLELEKKGKLIIRQVPSINPQSLNSNPGFRQTGHYSSFKTINGGVESFNV